MTRRSRRTLRYEAARFSQTVSRRLTEYRFLEEVSVSEYESMDSVASVECAQNQNLRWGRAS